MPSASLPPLIADARERNERAVAHGRGVLHGLRLRSWAHPTVLETHHEAMIDHLLSGTWEVPMLREALDPPTQDQGETRLSTRVRL